MPERWSLFYSRGIALERSGQWQRAEADLLHALELKPDQPLVLNYLGYSWIDRGENLERGLKMIEKAVELRPEDGYIVDSLGWAHYRLGDYPSAVQYLEKAIELVPEDPTINDHLGDAYWQSGRPVEARYQWRRALQFGPQDDEIKPIEAKLDGGSVPDCRGSARRLSRRMAVAAFAPAKVNLYLHVIGRRADGYHLLDSLVAFADIGDRLTAEPAASLSLDGRRARGGRSCRGRRRQPGAARRPPAGRPRRDRRRRRAASGQAPAGRRRDRRRIERRRGGAARAQAAVAAIARRTRRFALSAPGSAPTSRPASIGAPSGSAASASASSRPGRCREAGILLANPRRALPTAAVFAARRGPFGEVGRFAPMPADAVGAGPVLDAAPQRSDRGRDRRSCRRSARCWRGSAGLPGSLLARMSGSGATCFALFADRAAAEEARALVAAAEPRWWCAAGGFISGASLAEYG